MSDLKNHSKCTFCFYVNEKGKGSTLDTCIGARPDPGLQAVGWLVINWTITFPATEHRAGTKLYHLVT